MNDEQMFKMASSSNHCGFSNHSREEILLSMGCPALVSVACCIIAVSMVFLLRLCKHFVYRLASYQVLASLFTSISMALVLMLLKRPSTYFNVACETTAFLIEYSLVVKLLFTVWLTFHLFSYAVFFKNFKNLEWLYILSSVFVPLLFSWIPFVHRGYGVSGAWCYIRSWKNDCSTEDYVTGIIEQFAFYYGPAVFFLTVSIVAIAVMVVVMIRRAYNTAESETRPLIDRDQKVEALKQLVPLLAYPIIYFGLLLFPLTNRIYMAAFSSKSVALLVAHGVTHSSMGMFAAMALIVHICMLKSRRHAKYTNEEDYLSTFTGATPYTSGAVTKFSVPNESDVDTMSTTIK